MKRIVSIFTSIVLAVGMCGVMSENLVRAENIDTDITSDEHTHSYSKEITLRPTCTKKGVDTFTCECGDTYTKEIPALGHKYTTKTVKPTYFDKGYTLHACSVCKKSYKDKYKNKLNLATVKGLKTSSVSDNSVKLTWSKVKDANGYTIYKYDTKKKKWVKISNIKNSSQKYTVSKLKSGTKYQFAVKAYKTENKKEVKSTDYAKITVTTKLSNVKIKSADIYPTKIKLSWNKVSGAKGYNIYKKSGDKWKKVSSTKNTSYTVSKLSFNKKYTFAVEAYKDKLKSKSKTQKSAKTYYHMSKNPTVAEKKAAQVLDSVARQNKVKVPTLYMAYRKSEVKYIHFKESANLGTEWYAKYGLTNRKGNCYVMAAMMTTYARLLGYDAKQVSGDIGGSVHSWCEIKINGKVYVCDMSMGAVYGRNLYYKFPYHPISKGSKYYIAGDGKHPKYHRVRVIK